MSGYQLEIKARNKVAPFLAKLIVGLEDKTPLNAKIAPRAEDLTRRHLRDLARTKHATADRLGAKPTGHFSEAADAVSSRSASGGATVSIGSPGIGRAFRTLDIRPRNSKFLTIPTHADSYGKRARELDDLQIVRTKAGALLLIRPVPGTDAFETLYKLVRRVKIKQDRTLLPSDEEYLESMELGARDFIKEVKADTGGGSDA